MTLRVHFFAPLLLCCSLMAAQGVTAKSGKAAKRTPAPEVPRSALALEAGGVDVSPRAKVVQYGQRDVVTVRTKVRYTTLLVLPTHEQILDFTCGDKEFWVVNGAENIAYVKPAKPGAQTNLNLVTASGNIYSFELVEVSERSLNAADLKVFVELKDDSMASAVAGAPKFVSTEALASLRQQVDRANEQTQQARQGAQEAVDSGIAKFVSNVRFPYRFEAGKKPFFVRAMYHDDKFTYIQARPEETPTLYEIKEDKPNLVNFEYRNGIYHVGKILDRGYLVIGKKKLGFTRDE